MTRYFRVKQVSSPLFGRVGKLIGKIDYDGCRNGWHTLKIDNYTEILCAGEEIEEVVVPRKLKQRKTTNKG
jgi:hypothetical protein